MPSDDLLKSLGLDPLLAGEPFRRDATGQFCDPAGNPVVLVGAESSRGLHRVLEAEQAGAWNEAMRHCGQRSGERLAQGIDAALAKLGQPALPALPLEACLALLSHSFAVYGWGRIRFELEDAAEHGFVVARLENGFTTAVLEGVDGFVDGMIAGVLTAFFTHITGQVVGCEEIACVRGGAPHCVFVIAAPDRITVIQPHLGREAADAILNRLRR
ncbi:MAG: hypothetical protein HZC55_28045 [Verrucomicrobia bacterium]|nr:hypothetical protein [Verrucomicrobiota bacterium]